MFLLFGALQRHGTWDQDVAGIVYLPHNEANWDNSELERVSVGCCANKSQSAAASGDGSKRNSRGGKLKGRRVPCGYMLVCLCARAVEALEGRCNRSSIENLLKPDTDLSRRVERWLPVWFCVWHAHQQIRPESSAKEARVMFTGTSVVRRQLLVTHKCIQCVGPKQRPDTGTNTWVWILMAFWKGRRLTQTHHAPPRPPGRDDLTKMNTAIKKMTCLKCQTVASVFRIKIDSMRTQDTFPSLPSL